jgi:hypothetical protein
LVNVQFFVIESRMHRKRIGLGIRLGLGVKGIL